MKDVNWLHTGLAFVGGTVLGVGLGWVANDMTREAEAAAAKTTTATK